MRKFLRKLVEITIPIVILYVLVMLLSSPPISYDRIEREFQSNKENFFLVSEYLENSPQNDIRINFDFGNRMRANIDIEDDRVFAALSELGQQGYNVIGAYENTIHFQRWSGHVRSLGIVHSTDGNEPNLLFITRLEPLSELNWYYYEEDYNVWRTRNRENNRQDIEADTWQDSILLILFRSIPEMIAFSLIVLVMTKDAKNWKRAILIGVILAVIGYFDVQITAIMALALALFHLALDAKITRVIGGVLLGAALLIIGNLLFTFVFAVFFLEFTLEMITNNTFFHIVLGWPNIILMLVVAYILFKTTNQTIKE